MRCMEPTGKYGTEKPDFALIFEEAAESRFKRSLSKRTYEPTPIQRLIEARATGRTPEGVYETPDKRRSFRVIYFNKGDEK